MYTGTWCSATQQGGWRALCAPDTLWARAVVGYNSGGILISVDARFWQQNLLNNNFHVKNNFRPKVKSASGGESNLSTIPVGCSANIWPKDSSCGVHNTLSAMAGFESAAVEHRNKTFRSTPSSLPQGDWSPGEAEPRATAREYTSGETPFLKMEAVYKTNGERGNRVLVTAENYLLRQRFMVTAARFTCYRKDYLLFK